MQLSYTFFALLSMTVLATVKANVTLHKGYAPVNPANDLHSFFVVGDRNSVSFTTQPNENGQESDLVCSHIIPHSKGLGQAGGPLYTGPCEEDASKQSQVVVAQCIDKNDPKKQLSGKATITWYPSNSPDDQRKAAVHVETKGNVWVGTTADPAKTPLIQGPFTLGGLPKASVLINCNNSSRTPVAY